MRPVPLRILLFALALAASVSACGDKPAYDEEAADAAAYAEKHPPNPPDPPLTAQDSAKMRAVERYTDSVRAEVLRQSGQPAEVEAEGPPRPAADTSLEARYRSCMDMAKQGDDEMRPRLEAACGNLKNQIDARS